MIYAPAPVRAVRRAGPPALTSSALFRYQPRFRTLDALTGHVGTLTRASTLTVKDGLDVDITTPYGMPAYEARDYFGTGERDTFGLRLDTDDLAWPVAFPVGSGTMYVEGIEVSTRTGSDTLAYLGNDAISGGRLTLESSGTYYRAVLHNGTTSVTATLADAIPVADGAYRAAAQVELSDDATEMRVRLWLDVLNTVGDSVTAWTSYITTPATWGATTKLRLNRAGSAGAQGSVWVRDFAWFSGVLDVDDCARL